MTFLEETSSAATAPTEHRYHPKAARAAASIPDNVAERQGRAHSKEFLNHLSMARGSLMELETHLFPSRRVGLLEPTELEKLLSVSVRISRMLGGLRTALPKKLQD